MYWSRFGNNKKLVERLTGILEKKGAETQVLTTDEANPAAMPQADVYVFSAAAEAFSLNRNMKTFMKRLQGMNGKHYGLINTHGLRKHRLATMEKLLSKKKMVKRAEIDFHVEGDVQAGNGLPPGWETKLDEFASKI